VRAFVRAWEGPLHVLVDNAGVMAPPKTLTSQGWELQMATNHLGHFQLATGLHAALAAEGARVVSVSSRGHLRSEVVFDDLFFTRRGYDPWVAYGQSKTANVLFAVQADGTWADDGIRVNALHPGGILTNLIRHMSPEELASATADPAELKTVEQGAATSVLVAASPLVDGIGGRYFEDCNEALPNEPGTRTGFAAYAVDPGNAERLWDVSTRLLADVR
jgi:NAD(P)-dependent dehydrogenase (short-subunit alcohol dehydrogenase family)